MVRDRKKIITFLILDILVIVFIACNAQFGLMSMITAALDKVLYPENSYVAPKEKGNNGGQIEWEEDPYAERDYEEEEEPQDEPEDPVIPPEPSIYPIKVTFDAMGGTILGDQEIILDGETLTIDNFIIPTAEYGEYEFLRWEKEEKEIEEDGKTITVWDYYVVWNYRPVGYYTKIMNSGEFEFSGGKYKTTVAEEITTYDVLSQFIIRDTFAEIKLYSASTCAEKELVSGDINLDYGDNNYWIKIDAGENGYRIEQVDVYRLKSYTITYNKNGGSGKTTDTVYNNNNHYTFQSTKKAGYTFQGWYYDSGFANPAGSVIDVTSDVEVFAKWSDPITYTITYVPNGESYTGTMPTSYNVTAQPTFPSTATKEGYTFNYWLINGAKYSSTKTYAQNMTVTASFSEITYKVTYVLNGGTNNSSNKAASTYFDRNVTLYDPTRTGYTFLGWYYDSGFNSACPATIEVNEPTTIYAKWSDAIGYSITYTPQEGVTLDGVMPTEYTVASQPTIPNASKAGYEFLGWWLDVGNVMYDSSTTYHEDLTLTPRFDIITYSVEYDYAGGEADNADSYTVELAPVLNTPTKLGFIFDSWKVYDENDVELTFDPDFKYCKDIKLVAQYNTVLDANYGKYPQKVVSDSALITALDGVTPINGIYTYGDKEYIKMVAHPFMDGVTFTTGEEVIYGKAYYFELAPIEWVVVQSEGNIYTITTKYILDMSIFDTETHIYEDADIKEQVLLLIENCFTLDETMHMVALDEEGTATRIISASELDDTYLVAEVTDFAIARGCYYNPDNYSAFYFYLDEESEDRPEYALGYRASGDGESKAPLYIEAECGIRPIIKVVSGEEEPQE